MFYAEAINSHSDFTSTTITINTLQADNDVAYPMTDLLTLSPANSNFCFVFFLKPDSFAPPLSINYITTNVKDEGCCGDGFVQLIQTEQ